MLKNIKVLIQARTSSSRLPKKVLKKIGQYTILERVVKNVSLSKYIDDTIVLTSKSKTDDEIVRLCIKKKIKYFRGPLKNVSSRYFQAIKKIKSKYFIRISADSPFISHFLIDKLSKKAISGNYDIVTNTFKRTYPKGQSIEILKNSVYLKNYLKFKKQDLEHVTTYFYRNKKNFNIYNVSNKKNYKLINLSIDNKLDYERALFISKKLKNNHKLNKIIKLYFQYEKN